jgi:transposase
MAKSLFSTEEKHELIIAYQKRTISTRDFCHKHHVSKTSIERWTHLFETYGIEGLEETSGWKKYSKNLKSVAVEEYLTGKYSLLEVVRKYGLSSDSVLRRWVNRYNGHREIKETNKGMRNSMAKGRTTTLEERMEIVTSCLQNHKNYQQTADQYSVTYQQVYQWVRKFEKDGEVGLQDKRGKSKEETDLTPEEKIKREMARLERENERLRADNAFLKKLEELERRRF